MEHIIFFIVQSFKNEILSKILDIVKYNIVRHWFSSKNWIFAIFFKKVSIDGFSHYFMGNIIFFIVQSFKNEFLWKILDIQLYNIVRHWFSSKTIGILRFFLRNFLLPVFNIFHGTYYFFYCPKFQKWNFIKNPWYTKILTLYDIDFPQKIGFLRFFLRKFLLTVFHIFHRKYTPNFQKIDFSIYPNILYIFWSEFYARSNNQTIRIFG